MSFRISPYLFTGESFSEISLDSIGNPFAGLPLLEEEQGNNPLESVGNPFVGLPSLEERQKNDSLEDVGNFFAGLPSLEEGQKERCFEVRKSPSSVADLKVTKILLDVLTPAWGFLGRVPIF